jgi:putative ABC transport system ATP-binding protein
MRNSEDIVVELRDVKKEFATAQGTLTILDRVSFSVGKGERVAIVGPSGSGKSTLLSLIGLLDTPTAGSITIHGVRTDTLSEAEQAQFRSTEIGFIFQSFELISPFTARENIMAPLEIGKQATSPKVAEEIMERLGILPRADALPETLSGGEKQRVAIGRALIHRPTLILADEPTGSLDRATGERVLSLLLRATEGSDTTLIIITHDETVAKQMDRVFELRDNTLHERT